MVSIKKGMSQSQSQLFAIGAAILAEVKAKKNRAQVQSENQALFEEYVRVNKCKTLTELSAVILADGQSDPKWKTDKTTGKKVGYQKAIVAGSVGAAGYNSFRAWCAKWYTEDLVRLTPEDLKAKKNNAPPATPPAEGIADNAGETALKMAAEEANPITALSTAELIAELHKRADAGDAEAAELF